MSTITPVILIGAPRSGTNMLRDVIVDSSDFITWPCDEINFIWRHDNALNPTDRLSPEQATAKASNYIRGAFENIALEQGSPFVLEKTCANSLRVQFVNQIFPDAKFIFLVRHGMDATMSAVRRWQSKLNLSYTLAKLKYVPLQDLPIYASAHLKNRIKRKISGAEALSSWGPQFPGILQAVADKPLLDVCAMQWNACVSEAQKGLGELPEDRVFSIRYEDFVSQPEKCTLELLKFLDMPLDATRVASACAGVRSDSVGGWKNAIAAEDQLRLASIIGPTLLEFGYHT